MGKYVFADAWVNVSYKVASFEYMPCVRDVRDLAVPQSLAN